MTTWAQVHVGDTVRGADQRVWTVVRREQLGTWLVSGVTEIRFVFRHAERGDVRAVRNASDSAPLVAPADRTDLAAAFAALTDGGLAPQLLQEETLTDPFAAPAVAPGNLVRRGRYYLPDPVTGKERSWTRVSNVAKVLSDEYSLTRWKMRMVAKGIALRPDLLAGAAAADPEEDKAALNDIAEQAKAHAGGKKGANLGTALHSFAQRLDRGEPLGSLAAPSPLDTDAAEYVAALRRHRLTVHPEWMERVVVLPDLGVAGRFDRIIGQPAGVTHSKPLAIFDLKTEKDPSQDWLKIAIQLALYARAPLMWNPTDEKYEPMPEVDQDRALVLHLPVGRAHGQVYGINLIEGWTYAQLAMQVREARSGAKGLAWLVDPAPADLALYRVAKAADQAELAALWELLHPQGLWTEEVNAAAANRWEQINALASA